MLRLRIVGALLLLTLASGASLLIGRTQIGLVVFGASLCMLLFQLAFYAYAYIVWRRLPRAVLEVDGATLRFTYTRGYALVPSLSIAMRTLHETDSYFLDRTLREWYVDKFLAMTSRLMQPHVEEDRLITGPYPAALTVEGQVFQFSMSKSRGRCPCGRVPACWTGDTFEGSFVALSEEGNWTFHIIVTRLDDTDGEPVRKHAAQQPRLVPNFSLILTESTAR